MLILYLFELPQFSKSDLKNHISWDNDLTVLCAHTCHLPLRQLIYYPQCSEIIFFFLTQRPLIPENTFVFNLDFIKQHEGKKANRTLNVNPM